MENDLRILMIGGSGAVGRATVSSLLALSHLKKLTLLGRRLYEGFPDDSRLTQVVVDFDHLKVPSGHNVIVSCLGTTRALSKDKVTYRKIEVDYPVNFGKLAKNEGATQAVLVSSTGAKASSFVRYLAQKGEIEEAWTNLGFESLFILRPGLLERGDAARPVEKLYALLQKPIPVAVVGQAIASLVAKPALSSGHPVILNNREIYAEAAAAQSGRVAGENLKP